MSKKHPPYHLPKYHGAKWIRPGLPAKAGPWVQGHDRAGGDAGSNYAALTRALRESRKHAVWEWPKRPVYFLSDPHADSEAFVASLVASGGVKKTGPTVNEFRLTKAGNRGRFIIGGDCLDKGPGNLDLLRTVRTLKDQSSRFTLLAGNHDLRLLLGLRVLDMKRDPRTEHFFLRLGPKVVPMLLEIQKHYLQRGKHLLRDIPDERTCRRRMYPSKRWFRVFPELAASVMSEEAVEREMTRMDKKLRLFAERCAKSDLSMRMAYAAAMKCRELFLDREGEFSWFYHSMQLARREGAFLFIHAGFDDRIAALLAKKGIRRLNKVYRHQVHNDPFEFYYGPVANTLRTKYRKVDMPLTRKGVRKMHRTGIHAVVHGHRNLSGGQRIMLREGMLHIESDITMDRNTRKKEGLDGYGAGVTIVRPEGAVLGVSTDFPHVKVFRPADFFQNDGKASR